MDLPFVDHLSSELDLRLLNAEPRYSAQYLIHNESAKLTQNTLVNIVVNSMIMLMRWKGLTYIAGIANLVNVQEPYFKSAWCDVGMLSNSSNHAVKHREQVSWRFDGSCLTWSGHISGLGQPATYSGDLDVTRIMFHRETQMMGTR